MFKKAIILVFLLAVYFSTSHGSSLIEIIIEPDKNEEALPAVSSTPPQLWTDFKVLGIDAELCSVKAESILNALSLKSVRRNLKYDKAKYVYGVFNDTQVSVTCAKLEDKTFVYTSVAGPNKEVVERLRNEVVQKL